MYIVYKISLFTNLDTEINYNVFYGILQNKIEIFYLEINIWIIKVSTQ